MTQYFRILDCSEYETINQDLKHYVATYTNLLTPVPADQYQYANFPDRFGYDIKHFVQHNKKLVDFLRSCGCILRDAYFTLAWTSSTPDCPQSSCAIHLDKPPVGWKLNWPIVNMERTSVRFYHPNDPEADVNAMVTRSGNPNSKDFDRYMLDYENFHEVERHDFALNQPIIMYGQVAHDIGFYDNPVFPRIGLQAMFFQEPTHLL